MTSPLPSFDSIDGFDFNHFAFQSANRTLSPLPHHLSPLPTDNLANNQLNNLRISSQSKDHNLIHNHSNNHHLSAHMHGQHHDNLTNNLRIPAQSNEQSHSHFHNLQIPHQSQNHSHNKLLDHSINHYQSNNQSNVTVADHSVNHFSDSNTKALDHSINHYTDANVNLTVDLPQNDGHGHQSFHQSAEQPVNHSFHQPVNNISQNAGQVSNHSYNPANSVFQRGAPMYLPQWGHDQSPADHQSTNQLNNHRGEMMQNQLSGHIYQDLKHPPQLPVMQTVNQPNNPPITQPVNQQSFGQSDSQLMAQHMPQMHHHVSQTHLSVPLMSSAPTTVSVAPIDPAFNNNEKFASILLAPMEKRVARACTNCAASKVKCDNNRPCLRCRGVGKADSCFDSESRRRNRKQVLDSQNQLSHPTMAIPMFGSHSVQSSNSSPHSQGAAPVPAIVILVKPQPDSQPTNNPVNRQPGILEAPAVNHPYSSSSPPPFHSAQPIGQQPDMRRWQGQPSAQSSGLHSNVQQHYQSPPPLVQTPTPHQAPQTINTLAQPPRYEHSDGQPAKRQRVDDGISSETTSFAEHSQSDRRTPGQAFAQPLVAVDNHQRQRSSIHHPRNQPINQSISMSSLLFQFRALLPPALYGAFESIVQQFHAWNDELSRLRRHNQPVNPSNPPAVVQPSTQSTIQRILSARYWLRALIEQTVENPSSLLPYHDKPISPYNTPELFADQSYLATQCAEVWPQYLFTGPDLPPPSLQDQSRSEYSSLDDYLGRRIAEPTFIIGLSTADAVRAPPLVSYSLAQLFDYPFAQFASMLRDPHNLLQLRQYPDIVPLIPAFLSAISARADYYGHASEWKTRSGMSIELVTRVRICYTTTGTPFALMGQCQLQPHSQRASSSHHVNSPPILSINQSINHSINQSINQSVNQSNHNASMHHASNNSSMQHTANNSSIHSTSPHLGHTPY